MQPPRIPWSDEYKIGIKEIDLQHRKLFDLVNKLYELDDANEANIKESLRTILYEFSDYMKVHFKDEEAYMRAINYPDLAGHMKLHASIIEHLTEIIHTPAKLGIIKSKMKIVAKRSLVEHIMHEDTKIKLYAMTLPEEQNREEIFDLSTL